MHTLHRPEKYDREVVAKSIKALQVVTSIRKKRQDRFYEKRMLSAKQQQKQQDKRQLEQEIHLVKAPKALTEKAAKQKERVRVEEADVEDMQE